MKNLKKLLRKDLKKVIGGTNPIEEDGNSGGSCGSICHSHADCGAFGLCGVCVTTVVGLAGRCTQY